MVPFDGQNLWVFFNSFLLLDWRDRHVSLAVRVLLNSGSEMKISGYSMKIETTESIAIKTSLLVVQSCHWL